MNEFGIFERYRPIVGDWLAFVESLRHDLPLCIWANTLRTTPAELHHTMVAEGFELEPLPWHPAGFRLRGTDKPGSKWQFLAGLYHVQEEVSMLPVQLLDPQPGERVLDLCAAPGNKSAQAAVAMRNTGTLIANDINFNRLRALRQTVERLGLYNVTSVLYDGGSLPPEIGQFDRVIVDVPCSCEGTSRKHSSVMGEATLQHLGKRSGLQQALLRKAVQLCKPGGRLIYATCTYAPEENECVVEAIIREAGDAQLRLLPVRLPGFECSPGLTEWQGEQFDVQMANAMRVWPHQNDTGGFFLALLEKCGEEDAETGSASDAAGKIAERWHRPPRAIDATPYLELLRARFGIPHEAFSSCTFLQRNQEGIHLLNRWHEPPVAPEPETLGLFFMRTNMKYPKLSTAAATLYGTRPARNFIALTVAQRDAYYERRPITIAAEQARHCTGFGYVILFYERYALGIGLYKPAEDGQGGSVSSMFPKAWAVAENEEQPH